MLLKINLASRTYLNRKKFNTVVMAVGIVLGLFLLINIRDVASNAGDISSTARQIAVYDGKAPAVVPEKEYQTVLAKIRFANQIIDKKAFSWISLLDRLETVVPDGVALNAIEPNTKTGELKLGGVAKSFKNMRQLMENLESSNYFRDVFLVSQTDLKIGQTQRGLTFKIECKAALQ